MRPELLIKKPSHRMSPRRLCVAGAALALVAGVTVSAVSAAAASSTGPGPQHAAIGVTGKPALPGTPSIAAPTAQPQSPKSTTVTLPTGDQVQLSIAGGSQRATPVAAGTVHGKPLAPSTFVMFSWDGDQYVVPDAAVPYLRSTLDPRLFDVSYLARAGLGAGSAGIPVRITYTSPAQTASVPGLHVTRRSGVTATGTITTTQAAGLGRLLAAQWRAARSGRSRAPAGQLPGIKNITLARSPGAPPLPASPLSGASTAGQGLPFYTLTLNFTDLNGNPGTFIGLAQNVGDADLYTSATSGSGSESLSVPKGTYSLEFSILTPDPSGTGFDTALVVKPQVSVDSDTTVSLDARTAVPYHAALATPVSDSVRSDEIGFSRTSVTGGGTDESPLALPNLSLFAVSPNPVPTNFADTLLATPTAPVTKGGFFFYAFTALTNTTYGALSGSQGTDPIYAFDFPHQGSIPSSLTYTVPTADLTTVHQQFYAPPSGCDSQGQSQDAVNVYFRSGSGLVAGPFVEGLQVPDGERTDYWYSSEPRLDLWQPFGVAVGTSGTCSSFGGFLGAVQALVPGEQITEVWDKAPLVPSSIAPSARLGGSPQTYCVACRQDDNGALDMFPFADSDPSHQSDLYPNSASYSSSLNFYRNGTLAYSSAEFPGGQLEPIGLELPMLGQPAAYELDWTEALTATGEPAITNDWTFQSSPRDPAAAMPPEEVCAPDATRSCSFLPLLFLRYDLALNYNDQATADTPEMVNFTVTGQQNAPPPAGMSATVSASFDGGQTWTTPQPATSLGHGQFTTTISQPALASTDGFVALRVTAADRAGNGVTQTIINAYGLTS
jgi:hypothetical protein